MNSEDGQNEIVHNILAAIKRYIQSLDNPKNETGENQVTTNSLGILLNENRKHILLS